MAESIKEVNIAEGQSSPGRNFASMRSHSISYGGAYRSDFERPGLALASPIPKHKIANLQALNELKKGFATSIQVQDDGERKMSVAHQKAKSVPQKPGFVRLKLPDIGSTQDPALQL